jgi:hypothetical protein
MVVLCGSVIHKPMQVVVCGMHQHRPASENALGIGDIVSGSCDRCTGCHEQCATSCNLCLSRAVMPHFCRTKSLALNCFPRVPTVGEEVDIFVVWRL